MSVSISFARPVAGNMFSGDFGNLGRLQSYFSVRTTKYSCLNGRRLLMPQNYKPSVTDSSRTSQMICQMVFGREAEDRLFSNVNEDTDDMFDGLFDKYGKVVFKRNDQKPPSAEADDDAESLSFAVAMAKVANEVKAADIRVLFVKPLVYWTSFFIIATAYSRPQIDAIGSKIRDLAENKYGKFASGDLKPNSWTLLDFALFQSGNGGFMLALMP
ncbi:protein Iojap, chloroplastic isoform X2 [Malania oleifera]|uniref:protein Iojap, chloroplastic isoform X2 n=1 Tax=Malania oleifera TaxID=397392 RepID=UPI0025ADFE78|nr:protein Iojap, chloroplastic isoform X2 [Malania oleifera]